MRKKFVAAVAAFAALCGMVSVPANAAETTQPIREDVTPHVLVPIPVPESKLVSEPEPVDIDALAAAVIRGEYGDGEARRAALGDNYDAVQARVNELVPVAAPVDSQPVQAAPVVSQSVQSAPRSRCPRPRRDPTHLRTSTILPSTRPTASSKTVPTCRSAIGMTVRATVANRLTRISSICLTVTGTKLMRTP